MNSRYLFSSIYKASACDERGSLAAAPKIQLSGRGSTDFSDNRTRLCRLPGGNLADQRYRRKRRASVKSRLVVVISVIQHSANSWPDDSRHAPGGEQHTVVDASVLGSPKICRGGPVHRKLRSVAPVNHEDQQV